MPYKLIGKLNELAATVSDYGTKTEDAKAVRFKCDAAMQNFRKLRDAIQTLAPDVEQTKGIVKGLELACPIVDQFKLLAKTQYEKEEIDRDTTAAIIATLTRAHAAVYDSSRQRRDELLRAAGKIDGIYEAARNCIEQVKEYLASLEHQRRIMESKPHAFGSAEETLEPRVATAAADFADLKKPRKRRTKAEMAEAAKKAAEGCAEPVQNEANAIPTETSKISELTAPIMPDLVPGTSATLAVPTLPGLPKTDPQ